MVLTLLARLPDETVQLTGDSNHQALQWNELSCSAMATHYRVCRTDRIHGSATAVHRNIQRKQSSAIRTILLTVALIVVAAVSSLYQSSPAFLALAAQQKSGCTTAGGRTRCTCESDAEPVDLISTSISEDANEFEMECNTEMKFEPCGLKNSFACPAGTGELEECKCDEKPDQPHCLDIKTLLYGAPNSLQWTDSQAEGHEKLSKVLTIEKDNFPYVDGQFLVGCSNTSTQKCKVTVTVAARATVTKDRKVMCSYGKDSNKEHLTITLSPSQNSFTLECGEQGEIVQKAYKKEYCPVSTGARAARDCAGRYEDILPSYEEGWWTDVKGKSFTLTIPQDKFPKDGAKIMVQCQKEEQKSEKDSSDLANSEAKFQPSVCSVDVTIEGVGSSSSSSRSLQTAGFVGSVVAGAVSVLVQGS